MNSDIDVVARLRDIASLRGNMSGAVIPVACNEAADEIERLREQVEYLKANIEQLVHEAVRGE